MTSTPILHRGTDSGSNGCGSDEEHEVRRYDDPVEVRKGADEDPDQFLWRGRLWQVREVVAHWVETGAWWARPHDGPGGRSGGHRPAARARGVAGDRGPGKGRRPRRSPEHDPGYGVFDLVFSWSEGSWQLVRAMD